MFKYICKHLGCKTIIDERGYCDKHKGDEVPNKPFANAIRYNDKLYQSYRWKKLRKQILIDNPICSYCGSTVSLQVHHVIRPRGDESLFFDIKNLIVVCKICHDKMTGKETHTPC